MSPEHRMGSHYLDQNLNIDLGIRAGCEQAAPLELEFNDVHFSTNRPPPSGLVTDQLILKHQFEVWAHTLDVFKSHNIAKLSFRNTSIR